MVVSKQKKGTFTLRPVDLPKTQSAKPAKNNFPVVLNLDFESSKTGNASSDM